MGNIAGGIGSVCDCKSQTTFLGLETLRADVPPKRPDENGGLRARQYMSLLSDGVSTARSCHHLQDQRHRELIAPPFLLPNPPLPQRIVSEPGPLHHPAGGDAQYTPTKLHSCTMYFTDILATRVVLAAVLAVLFAGYGAQACGTASAACFYIRDGMSIEPSVSCSSPNGYGDKECHPGSKQASFEISVGITFPLTARLALTPLPARVLRAAAITATTTTEAGLSRLGQPIPCSAYSREA